MLKHLLNRGMFSVINLSSNHRCPVPVTVNRFSFLICGGGEMLWFSAINP